MDYKIIKQVIGIDVAQQELVCRFGQVTDQFVPMLKAAKTFENSKSGMAQLLKWAKQQSASDQLTRFVMEATGVYHEALAYFLHQQDQQVTIVSPSKISHFFRTLDLKTITDKTAAEAITQFGLEKNLESWVPPRIIFKRLKQLTRERLQVVEERSMVKNRLHAEKAEADPLSKSLDRAQKRIKLLNTQEKEIIKEINDLVKGDQELNESVELLMTIPGIGLITAATILGETDGFNLIRNKKQLTGYAGLDPIEKQSGTSVKGKARISKKGNKNLRRCIYLPAWSGIKCNEDQKAMYIRLVSKHGLKKKAQTAIQRKLLELTYTIWKTKQAFDPEYELKRVEAKKAMMAL